MAAARVTVSTNTTLIALVRDELLDPSVDPAGLTIAEAAREFTDAQIHTALADVNIFLDRRLRINHPGSNMVYVDSSYTSGAVSTDFPATIGRYDPIVKIETISDTMLPQVIPYVSPQEIERFALTDSATAVFPLRMAFVHTLIDNGVTRAVMIRPRPAGLSVRIWYIGAPVTNASSSEDNLLSTHWRDLLVLKTAINLGSRKNMATDQQLMRYGELMKDFTSAANRQRQPVQVRRVRRGVS